MNRSIFHSFLLQFAKKQLEMETQLTKIRLPDFKTAFDQHVLVVRSIIQDPNALIAKPSSRIPKSDSLKSYGIFHIRNDSIDVFRTKSNQTNINRTRNASISSLLYNVYISHVLLYERNKCAPKPFGGSLVILLPTKPLLFDQDANSQAITYAAVHYTFHPSHHGASPFRVDLIDTTFSKPLHFARTTLQPSQTLKPNGLNWIKLLHKS